MHAPSAILALLCAIPVAYVSARADTLTKLSEVKRGEISKLAIAGLDYGQSALFVTAVRDGDDKLRLLVWAAGGAGAAEVRTSHPTNETIKDVAATVLSGKRLVTAVRGGDDRLRVIAWRVGEDGRSVERLGTAVGARVSRLAATTNTSGGAGDRVVVAARSPEGNLAVASYVIDGNSVSEGERATYGGIDTIAASRGVTNTAAMRDGEGKLRLIHFWQPLFRGGLGTGQAISDVRIVQDLSEPFSAEWFTFSSSSGPTAVRTGAGCTQRRMIGHGLGKIIGWKLANTSINADLVRSRELELTDFGGIAKAVDLVFLDSPLLSVVTGHLGFDNFCRARAADQGKPRLQLTIWNARAREDALVKAGEAHLGGDYTDIAMTEIAASGAQRRIAVALRGANGVLKVTVWGIVR